MQRTSTTDAQVCVKNYNSDSNNKDIITVDYLITGGRQGDLLDHLREKQMCYTKQNLYYHVPKFKDISLMVFNSSVYIPRVRNTKSCSLIPLLV